MRLLSTSLLLALVAGCSSSDNDKQVDSGVDSADAAKDIVTTDDDSTVSAATTGAFVVSLVEPTANTPGQTKVVGKVNDGPTPEATIWEEATTQGDCRLLTPRAPFCDPVCSGGSVCVEDDTCLPHPKPLAVGTVTLDGLETTDGKTTFTMEPIANNYQPAVELIYPACSENEAVTLSAAGGDAVAAFSLTAKGIAPLELLSEALDLADGKAVTLKWTPGNSDSRVQVLLDISHHGGTKGKIVCDTADSGSLELSADMLDQLKALGVAGFPTVVLTRRSASSTPADRGNIALVIDSRVEREVKVPGVVSCMEDADCVKAGLTTCQDDRRCK